MVTVLRNLQDFIRTRTGLEGICDTCGQRWDVNLRRAVEVLGGNARPDDCIGRAKCPKCADGRYMTGDPVVGAKPVKRPTWFPRLIDDYNDQSSDS